MTERWVWRDIVGYDENVHEILLRHQDKDYAITHTGQCAWNDPVSTGTAQYLILKNPKDHIVVYEKSQIENINTGTHIVRDWHRVGLGRNGRNFDEFVAQNSISTTPYNHR